MGNHKGEKCILNPSKFCQEGYCEDCEIARKWDRLLKEAENGNHG